MTVALSETYDPELPVVEAIRSGDRFAFEELVRRHDSWIRGVIFGVLGDADRVDDVAQQAWLAVWQQAANLRDVRRWRPWLYRVVYNAAIDAGRHVSRRRGKFRALPTQESALPAHPDSAEQPVAEEERRTEVLAAVAGLPPLYREPFVLRHMNGWSYQEIATAMGMPVDTVETRLVRARRLLRETLKHRIG